MDNQSLNLNHVRIDSGKTRTGSTARIQKARRRISRRRIRKWILRGVGICLILLILGAGAYVLLTLKNGYTQLKAAGGTSTPELSGTLSDGTQIDLEPVDDSTLVYKGKTYRYKDNMVNLLLLGVDSTGTLGETPENARNERSQSDVILLAAMDTQAGTITVIPVNRDTMTRITINDINGNFLRYSTQQIALSYAYGDGSNKSAQLTEEAVSYLFYGLPIHGYFSVNISAISLVNDLVGGVEVTLPEDFVEEFGDGYVKGTTVTLKGSMAETYIRKRYNMADTSNTARMQRQRTYLFSLAEKILEQTKKNLTLPLTIYQAVEDYMVTDISIGEFSYLATKMLGCTFDEDSIRSIDGTLKRGTTYQEFYPDEQQLYELILDVFYEETE